MISLSDSVLLESDIQAGGGATTDLHFEYKNGYLIEDKTLADGFHLYSEVPISSAVDDLSDDQTIIIASTILQMCSRGGEKRPMSGANRKAFDTADNPTLSSGGLSRTKKTARAVFEKLVAEIRYDFHDFSEIKEAIVDYYA